MKQLKVLAWGLLGSVLVAGVTFLSKNLGAFVDMTGLSSEMKVIILGMAVHLVAMLTKFLNQKFSLEEKLGAMLGRR